MALAFMVIMPEGVVAYKNHLLLDSFGPIMSNGAKAKNRTIHMTLQARKLKIYGEISEEKIGRRARFFPEEFHQQRL